MWGYGQWIHSNEKQLLLPLGKYNTWQKRVGGIARIAGTAGMSTTFSVLMTTGEVPTPGICVRILRIASVSCSVLTAIKSAKVARTTCARRAHIYR